jgi:hypothetical protein
MNLPDLSRPEVDPVLVARGEEARPRPSGCSRGWNSAHGRGSSSRSPSWWAPTAMRCSAASSAPDLWTAHSSPTPRDFRRRVFWLLPHDRDAVPLGIYATGPVGGGGSRHASAHLPGRLCWRASTRPLRCGSALSPPQARSTATARHVWTRLFGRRHGAAWRRHRLDQPSRAPPVPLSADPSSVRSDSTRCEEVRPEESAASTLETPRPGAPPGCGPVRSQREAGPAPARGSGSVVPRRGPSAPEHGPSPKVGSDRPSAHEGPAG